MTYAVVSQRRTVEELSYLVETISRALLSVPGLLKSGVLAALTVNSVEPESARLQALGLRRTGKRQIRFNVNLPGGRAEVGGSEQAFGRWAVPTSRC